MLNEVYQLESELLRIQQSQETLSRQLRQAKYNLRTASAALVEYEGSIRALIHKFTGKHQDRVDQLSREKRLAEAEQNRLLVQQEDANARLDALNTRKAALPSWPSFCEGENRPTWAKLELSLCSQALLPRLDDADSALSLYRQMLRGEIPMLSIGEQQSISAAPIAAVKDQAEWLSRLENALTVLESTEKIPEFFQNPAGFLSAAARHNQLERAADAETHILRLRRLLKNHL